MSDQPDKSEKIHDPSAKRIRKAREEGNVFRSKEIVSVGMLIIGLSVMMGGAPFAFQTLKEVAMAQFQSAMTTELTVLSVPTVFANIWLQLLIIAVPFAVVLVVAAMGLNIMQSGWNVSLKALVPKGNRVSPMQGIKRMFSSKGLFDFGKSLVKILIVGPIAYTTISGKMPEILMLHRLPIDGILATAGMWIMLLLAKLIGVLLLLSGIDFAFEKWRYKKDLMMTTKEVKDEAKETEGDPQIKAKRRQVARSLSQRPRLDHAVLGRPGGDQPDALRRRLAVRPRRVGGAVCAG